MARLGDYVRIRTGKLDANASREDGAYPFFTCSREPLRIDTYSYDCECVLVAGNGDLNVKYYSGKFDAYQRTYIIEVIDPNILLPKYLFHFLDSYVDILRKQSIGGVIKYIKLGNLTEAIIPLPSIEKQAQIVKTLEQCNSVIAIAEMQLSKLDELVKSRFIELFGEPQQNSLDWEIVDLESYTTIVTYGLTVRPKYMDDGIDLVSARELHTGRIDFNNAPKISEYDFLLLSEKAKPKFNDILFSKTGSIGHCALVKDCRQFAITQNAARIGLNTGVVNPVWLLCYLRLDYIQDWCKKHSKGNAVKDFQLQDMKKIPVLAVPKSMQDEFAAFVEQTDKLKLEVKNSIEKLETLKKSLMQEYFG